MRRKAFLIGSPLIEGENGFLAGVSPDIEAMKAHLMSLPGGAWYEQEIQVFNNPMKTDLETAMKLPYDFVVVQYSGHGFEYSDADTQLDINPEEKISLVEIHRWISAPRKYYFLDCCRGVEPTLKKSFESLAESHTPDTDAVPVYRKLYEDIVDSCEQGASIIYSCDVDESADEDPKGKGGVFTISFLSTARGFRAPEGKYYSINSVFDAAKKKLKTLYPMSTQTPQMKPERRNRYFPFVI